jgi:CRP-like cAMP-binding protein/tRNA A-37 threonylcarbamoyl transferase component Bud32
VLDIQLAQGQGDSGTIASGTPEESHAVREASSILQVHLCSELLNAVPREAGLAFLQHMQFRRIKQGERIIQQGERGNFFYLILQGTCVLNVEKNNVLYNAGQLGPGDAAGEAVLLNDEPQKAHVDAETETDVLGMSREEYEALSAENPELRNFLSAVLTRRLGYSTVTGERTIGKYTVTEKIGQGGSSIIYKGVHGMLGMPVAIKMLKHEMAMDPDFLEIFRNEAKIIAQFNHPNIVKVYDIEEVYRTLFIIMEYLSGTLLKNMVSARQKLSIPRVVDIAMQVCYGLEYAHQHGIIHQDVNPGNIFIQPDGQVKIIDFGLAIQRGGVDSNFLFPGTIYYISPEQLKGEPVDERADIYSLGMTVYEMITGKRPFPGCHMKTIVDWHLHKEIPDSRITMKELPDELHAFLRRTIRKDPSERYRNITEALKELRPLAERLGVNAQPCFCKQNKMIGMFLMYQEEEQLALKRFIEEFNRNVSGTGAVLRITRFDDT